MTSSDQAVVSHGSSLSSKPGEGLIKHTSHSLRQPMFCHHSLSTKHANELDVHRDSMSRNVRISTDWMQIGHKCRPTSFAGLGCLPLLSLLQVDLLEHALPEPLDGRIHILGLTCLQKTHTTHHICHTNKRAARQYPACLETCAGRQDLVQLTAGRACHNDCYCRTLYCLTVIVMQAAAAAAEEQGCDLSLSFMSTGIPKSVHT